MFAFDRLRNALPSRRDSRTAHVHRAVGRVLSIANAPMEPLEQRLHLAAVVWDGGAGTDSWHDALNWSNDAVPTADDDVTIPDTALAEVRIFSGSGLARSLTTDKNLRIQGSQALWLSQGAVINGTLTIGDDASSAFIYFNGSGAQTLGGTGTVVFPSNPSGYTHRLYALNDVALTIGAGVTIRGGNGEVRTDGPVGSITNLGTIAAEVDAQTLTLSGPGSFVNSGVVSVSNGARLSVNTTLTNTGSTIEVGSQCEVNVSGAVVGGTINGQAGSTIAGTWFRGVTLTGQFRIAQNSVVQVEDGLTVNGTLTIGDDTYSAFIYFNGSGAQTLGGTGTVVFPSNPSGYTHRLYALNDVALTIGAGVTIRGGNGEVRTDGPVGSITNLGTIAAEVDAQTLTLSGPGSFVNSGVVSVSNGARLSVNTTLTNTGSTIEVGSQCEVNVSGAVVGGTINGQAGSTIAGAWFRGVTLTGQFRIAQNSAVQVENGLTVNGTLIIGDDTYSASVYFYGTGPQTLGGTGTVVFPSNPSNYTHRLYVYSDVLLIIGAGVTIRGGNGDIRADGPGGSIINTGTIAADVNGQTLALSGSGSFVNNGAVSVSSGARLSVNTSLTNTGSTIEVDGQSEVSVSGVVVGGTINGQAGSTISGNWFRGVTLTGQFRIAQNSGVFVENGLTVNGTLTIGDDTSSAFIYFNGSGAQTLGGSGTVLFPSNPSGYTHRLHVYIDVTLTIGAGVTIRGGNGDIRAEGPGGSIINTGTIAADANGQTLALSGSGVFINSGALSASNGARLSVNTTLTNTGSTIEVGSQCEVNVSGAVVGGTINGQAGSTIAGTWFRGVTLTGQFRIAQNSVVQVEDGLTVNGTLIIGDDTYSAFISFYGTGPQTLGGTGTVVFPSNPANYTHRLTVFDGIALTIAAGFTIRGGRGDVLVNGTAASITNLGTIVADVNGQTLTLDGQSQLLNQGLLRVANDGVLSIIVPLLNSGVVRADGGSVQLTGGGAVLTNLSNGLVHAASGSISLQTGSNAGEFRTSPGGTIDLPVSFSHLAGATNTGLGSINLSGGTHTFAAGTFDFSPHIMIGAATVTGPGSLRFSGLVTISGGNFVSTGAVIFGATSQVTVSSAGGAGFYNLSAQNLGSFTFSGDLYLGSGAVFTNRPGGVVTADLSAGARSIRAGGLAGDAGTNQFVNEGMFIKTGSASLNIDRHSWTLAFINHGTVRIDGGAVQFGNSAPPADFENRASGWVNVASGSLTVRPGLNAGRLTVGLDGTAVFVNAIPQIVGNALVGGMWEIDGILAFAAGTNLLSLGPGATLSISPTALLGGQMLGLAVNNGTLVLRNPGSFPFSPAGGVFFNNAVVALTGTGTFSVPPAVTFNNGPAGAGGIVRVGDNLRGPGSIIIDGPINGGMIDIFGTATFNQNLDIFAVINLYPGGTLNGAGHITTRAAFNWIGGTQSGTGTTTAAAVLNLVSSTVMTLARPLTNAFAGNWTGGCLLLDGGQFANATGAGFTISGSVEVQSTGQGGEAFINNGALIFAAGSESSFGTGLQVTNNSSGVIVIAAVLSFEEDETLHGGVRLVDGGEITGPGNLTLADRFEWQGGAMTGTGRTIFGVDALLTMGDNNMTIARIVDNMSTAGNWTGGCLLMAGGIFNNLAGASLTIFADPRIDVVGLSGVNQFNNAGLITVQTGEFVIGVPGTNTGTIVVIPPDTLIFAATWFYLPGSSIEGPGGVTFAGGMHSIPVGGLNVTGPIRISGGALILPALFMTNYDQATHTFTGGNWIIGDGAQLFLNGADIRTIGPGTSFTLAGNWTLGALENLERVRGTLRLENGAVFNALPPGGAAFRNDGLIHVSPGAVLAVGGNYQQGPGPSGGTLEIGITGVGAGQQGSVTIAGVAGLAGSLRLAYAEGVQVRQGDTFRFLAAGTIAGAFDSTSVTPGSSYLRINVAQDAQGLRFTVFHMADHNMDFRVDVADIFSFLSSWFLGEADFDGDGLTAVPDIFAYLSAWFSV